MNQTWVLNRKTKVYLESLGENWLKAGADSFGFRINGRTVYCIRSESYRERTLTKSAQEPAPPQQSIGLNNEFSQVAEIQSISARVRLGDSQNGTLFVDGLDGLTHQQRLDLDASFFGDTQQLQSDVDTISDELVEKQDQLVTLYQLSQTMRRHLEIQPLFSSLIVTLQSLFHSQGLFTLVSSGGLSPIVSAYPDNSLLDGNIIRALQEMHQEKESTIFNETDFEKIENLLFLPLHVKDPFQASFVFVNKLDGPFATPDLKLAQLIGEQISAQFEYVQLHQELLNKAKLQAEADMARNVQMQLLPTTPPSIAGLDLFAQSKPASQVGGDFYVFMPDAPLPQFVLGDVSGKGMPAALLMTMLRSSFQSAARVNHNLEQLTPDVMNDASRSMYGDFTAVEMFATAVVAAFDVETRELSYSNAGHSPVIYCPAGGEPEILPANGPAMGVVDMDVAGQNSITLQPDDLFIICTDGFVEVWNEDGEMYGYDRLLDLVSSIRHYSAMEIAIEMYIAIEEYSGGTEQDDDQTLIVTKGVDHESK